MSVQERPRCFGCAERVEYDPIFASPCDHERCRSAVWHGLCLMSWRETREQIEAELKRWLREHTENDL